METMLYLDLMAKPTWRTAAAAILEPYLQGVFVHNNLESLHFEGDFIVVEDKDLDEVIAGSLLSQLRWTATGEYWRDVRNWALWTEVIVHLSLHCLCRCCCPHPCHC